MPDVWAIIVSVIILMVIYGYVSSKISDRKKKKQRQETVPEISDSIKTGINYNIHLSDGRKFENVVIVGSVEGEDEAFSFAGYEGLLVFNQQNGKKVYLKKPSIRYIEES
ncbi:MAG: hypothetical protein KC426_05820 [Oceanospirillaceae bacterium]|nr:hypothetical protein [Oceanospirillaceae bacterium]